MKKFFKARSFVAMAIMVTLATTAFAGCNQSSENQKSASSTSGSNASSQVQEESSKVEESKSESSVEEKSQDESKVESSVEESSKEESKVESSVQESSQEESKVESSVEEKSQEESSRREIDPTSIIRFGRVIKETRVETYTDHFRTMNVDDIVGIVAIHNNTIDIFYSHYALSVDASSIEVYDEGYIPDLYNNSIFGFSVG